MAVIFRSDFDNQDDFNKWKNSFSPRWKWMQDAPNSSLSGVANLSLGSVKYELTSAPFTLIGNNINGVPVSISFNADLDLGENAKFNIRISNDGGLLWFTYEILIGPIQKSIRHENLQIAFISELIPTPGNIMDILVRFELETPITDTSSKISISSVIVDIGRPGGGDGTTPTPVPKKPPSP